MSSNILTMNTGRIDSKIKLELGGTFVTRGQQVIKIVEHHEKLVEPNVVEHRWIGDNGVVYKDGLTGSVSDQPETNDDILLSVGSDINQEDISKAFEYVSKAEDILNPVGLAVDVHPTSREPELEAA